MSATTAERDRATTRAVNLLLLTLTDEPLPSVLPESYVYLLAQHALSDTIGVSPREVLDLVIATGLLKRERGHVLVAGPEWNEIASRCHDARKLIDAARVARERGGR